jgi:hypothetical protein
MRFPSPLTLPSPARGEGTLSERLGLAATDRHRDGPLQEGLAVLSASRQALYLCTLAL